MLRTLKADDVSLSFLLLYVTGLIFIFAYLVLLNAFAVWVPTTVQVAVAIAMVVIKIFLDAREAKLRNCRQSNFMQLHPASAHE